MSNVASTFLPFLATMLPVMATMSNEISSFRQCRNKLNMFNLFRICRKDEISFDIVAEIGNIVAENGSNVEATFDFVEGTKFYNRIVRHCCYLWQKSRMLLRQRRTFDNVACCFDIVDGVDGALQWQMWVVYTALRYDLNLRR